MKVGVFGAGAIGCFLGLRLSAAGVPTTLLGRPRLVEVADDLAAYTVDGAAVRPGSDLIVTADPARLADVDVCLVCVKSRDTAEAGSTLGTILRRDAAVVSFQNGLRNPDRLCAALDNPVVPGMVSYNVLREPPATFRQATKGPLVMGRGKTAAADRVRALADAFRRGGERIEVREDVEAVMAGKLLLNLNNGICAVTGKTIAESLRSRALRRCFAHLMREGLGVMRAAGLRPASVVGIPPWIIARVLTLPNFIVLRVAKSLVAIDPRAKSSTLQDLERGKPTEIDDLSGEIVALARTAGTTAPANQLIVDAIHDLERAAPPLPFWTPAALERRLLRPGDAS